MPRDADNRLQRAYNIRGGIGRLMLLGAALAFNQAFLHESSAQSDAAKPQPFVLDGTKWDMELTSWTAKGKKKTEKDTLIFSSRQLTSRNHARKGYAPTHYAVSARGDGVTTFETMQIRKDETSFWKGEVSEDEMVQGSLHVQDSKGNVKEYYFKGKLVSGTLRRKGEKVPEPPSSVEPATAPLKGAAQPPAAVEAAP